ncbi:MAG TPA: hypothetical protein VLY23_12795 [Candidatus Acidoferrum sp.]|nr:hypothetical protein [Candidatus Acidoferrum sp.]
MQENLRMIAEMLRHDPAVVLGFVFIGIQGVLFAHVQLKLTRAGYKFRWISWNTVLEYLRVRAKHGWLPWPAYLIWPCLIAGAALLVFGLFHLPD